MTPDTGLWIAFHTFVAVMLALDLLVFHRRKHVDTKEAVGWSVFWVVLALAFGGVVWIWRGPTAGTGFLTAWLMGKSLAVDNLFVLALIFSFFGQTAMASRRVLFVAIVAALAIRLPFVTAGVALLANFSWASYALGAWLIFAGIHLWFERERYIEPDKSRTLSLYRRLSPHAAPAALAIVMAIVMDVLFAANTVPATLAISQDTLVVYAANAFSILGLSALYFALSGVMSRSYHLHYGLAALLVFFGSRMISQKLVLLPDWLSLAMVVVVLAVTWWGSLRWSGSDPIADTMPVGVDDGDHRPSILARSVPKPR
jgi:tellurite resistance protein TerC